MIPWLFRNSLSATAWLALLEECNQMQPKIVAAYVSLSICSSSLARSSLGR